MRQKIKAPSTAVFEISKHARTALTREADESPKTTSYHSESNPTANNNVGAFHNVMSDRGNHFATV